MRPPARKTLNRSSARLDGYKRLPARPEEPGLRRGSGVSIRPRDRANLRARVFRALRSGRRSRTGALRRERARRSPRASRTFIQTLVPAADGPGPFFPFSTVRGKRMSAVMNATETDVVAETKQMLKEGGVTVEYQRRKAKEMVKFFKQQAYDQAVEDSQVCLLYTSDAADE